MDRMLYVAMSGAKETMYAQANNANNLANANTTGFKQDFNVFRAQFVQGPGWDSRAYAMDERPATDFSPGAINLTWRNLDVYTETDGFMAIQTPNDSEALIRTSSLQVQPDGSLVDQEGNSVLNAGGTAIVLPPYEDLSIADDGTILLQPIGAELNEVVAIDQLRLVKPDFQQLQKDKDGYIRFQGDRELNQAEVRVTSGALEASNVSTVGALVDMIELSRKYEMQIKMMSTSKTLAQKSDQLLSIR
jgi:flagellar basal-body rod protein FlgF